MEDTLRNIKLALTGLSGAISAVFGWIGWLVILWVGCMAADYFTGTLAAAKEHEWSSGKALDGLWHKGGMLFVVLAAAALDVLIGIMTSHIPGVSLPFDYHCLLTPLVLCWYVVTELGSIAENAVDMGAPCPPFFKKALEIAQSKMDDFSMDNVGSENNNED